MFTSKESEDWFVLQAESWYSSWTRRHHGEDSELVSWRRENCCTKDEGEVVRVLGCGSRAISGVRVLSTVTPPSYEYHKVLVSLIPLMPTAQGELLCSSTFHQWRTITFLYLESGLLLESVGIFPDFMTTMPVLLVLTGF